MRNPSIPCPKCGGSGSVDLPESLASALALFKGKKERCAFDLAQSSQDAITANGWNKRLEALREAGLLDRRRKGKFWMYFRK